MNYGQSNGTIQMDEDMERPCRINMKGNQQWDVERTQLNMRLDVALG